MDNKQSLGAKGEELAVNMILESGLKVVTRNYRCPVGEMDIVARDGKTLVFIEVRTRRSSYRGWGEESITRQKAQRLQAIASFFLIQKGHKTWPDIRFDVVAIRWVGEKPEVNWIKAALS